MIDGFFWDGGFDMFFSLFFIIFIAIFLFIVIAGITQWTKNNNSPRLTVPAIVTAKRSKVSGGGAGNDVNHSSSTWYYATFEVESGDRMELTISGTEYGQLADGDRGRLTFQGTRYIQFERTI